MKKFLISLWLLLIFITGIQANSLVEYALKFYSLDTGVGLAAVTANSTPSQKIQKLVATDPGTGFLPNDIVPQNSGLLNTITCTNGYGLSFNGTNWVCSPLIIPVNGVCGPATQVQWIASPDSNLCSAGVASTVSQVGDWNWTCNGVNGGATVSCEADYSCGSRTRYQASSVPCVSSCVSETQNCLNNNWNGTYTNSSCSGFFFLRKVCGNFEKIKEYVKGKKGNL